MALYTHPKTIPVCTASLDFLRKDYGSGALKADEALGQHVVTDWDSHGTMLVKKMNKLTVWTLDIQFFENKLTAMTKQSLLTLLTTS